MQKRPDGVVESSNESLVLFQLLKQVKALNRRVDQLEKQVKDGSNQQPN